MQMNMTDKDNIFELYVYRLEETTTHAIWALKNEV
jgi:hypothetical protein